MFFRKKEKLTEFEKQTLPGIPSVFTGGDTTLGELRTMAKGIRDEDARTEVERGLAISVVALIDYMENKESCLVDQQED